VERSEASDAEYDKKNMGARCVASPLPSQDSEPTYLDFFGMARAPFCSLPAPSEIFYSDQCSLLNSHLTGATEKPDSLVVVCGADGSGKTTLLNQYLAGLGDDLCHAAFDETCVEATQFYCSFLTQIGFGEISGTLRELQRITREFLIHQGKRGEHVLFIVDSTQLVRPAVLEQLRWIAEINIDNEHVLSVVLAGNLNLPRILDSPAMRSLKFRYQTNFHIRAYSEIETDDYVRHHLNLAGAADAARFSDESRALIYRFTGGIPRTINRLCNAVLTESCAQGTRVINEERIRSVAAARRILPHVVPIKGKGRRKTDLDLPLSLLMPDFYAGERMTGRQPDTTLPNGESWKSSLRHDVELNELLAQVAELSSQLEGANEVKRRAVTDAEKQHKDLCQVRAQLGAQIEAAGNLAQALDDKAKAVGQLNAALSASERRRQDAEKIGRSLAAHMDELLGTLDASNKEVEALTARQMKFDDKLHQLTQALAESEVTLAQRNETVDKLAADLDKWESSKSDEVITELRAQLAAQATEFNGLLTTVASSAAEIATLKEAISDGNKALLQSETSSKHLIAELETERGLTNLANTMLSKTHKRLEILERNNSELQTSVQQLSADLEASAKKAGKIDALEKSLEKSREEYATLRNQLEALPLEKKTILHSTTRKSVSANGNATTIELLLDGKLVKIIDLAGGPSRILIGRAQDCELHLNNKFVSRHHALISCTADRIAIDDLHSSNGIHVNSRKVGHSDLRPGDTVAIGDFRLRLKRG
jgi:type II secretory pathway predicted ATPase ExeA